MNTADKPNRMTPSEQAAWEDLARLPLRDAAPARRGWFRRAPKPTRVPIPLEELKDIVVEAVREGIRRDREKRVAGYVIAWSQDGAQPTNPTPVVFATPDVAEKMRDNLSSLNGNVPVVYALVPVSGDPTP